MFVYEVVPEASEGAVGAVDSELVGYFGSGSVDAVFEEFEDALAHVGSGHSWGCWGVFVVDLEGEESVEALVDAEDDGWLFRAGAAFFVPDDAAAVFAVGFGGAFEVDAADDGGVDVRGAGVEAALVVVVDEEDGDVEAFCDAGEHGVHGSNFGLFFFVSAPEGALGVEDYERGVGLFDELVHESLAGVRVEEDGEADAAVLEALFAGSELEGEQSPGDLRFAVLAVEVERDSAAALLAEPFLAEGVSAAEALADEALAEAAVAVEDGECAEFDVAALLVAPGEVWVGWRVGE